MACNVNRQRIISPSRPLLHFPISGNGIITLLPFPKWSCPATFRQVWTENSNDAELLPAETSKSREVSDYPEEAV